MKKIVLFILILSMFLCGCHREPSPTEPSQIQTLPVPSATEPEPTQETTAPYADYETPMISFTAAMDIRDFQNGSGGTLLRYSSQIMEVLTMDPQVSEAVTLGLLNLSDYDSTPGPQLLKDARESASAGKPFELSVRFDPQRLDSTLLSILSTQVISDDNIKASALWDSVTFDLLTGRSLTLKDVLVPDYSAPALCKAITDALAPMASKGQLFVDYTYVIEETFSTNTPVTNWYFSDEGLCFYFDPYAIAPYSMGFVTAQIPYDALTGLLREEYFPEEHIGLVGNVVCIPSQDTVDSYSQFRELILDPQGDAYLITALGAVEDLRIQRGTYVGETFLPDATLFAASTLCRTDAVLVQIPAAEINTLRISYRSGEDTVSLPLSAFLLVG